METFLAGALDALGLKNVVAMLAFSTCVGLGAFIDSEAKPAFKEKVRASLQAGSWFALLRNAYAHIGSVLDVWLGPKLFSWRMLLWTSIITIAGSLTFTWIAMTVQNKELVPGKKDDNLLLAVMMLSRIPIAIMLDYVTLVRVRIFCRSIVRRAFLPSLIVAILIDALTLILAVLLNYVAVFVPAAAIIGNFRMLFFGLATLLLAYRLESFSDFVSDTFSSGMSASFWVPAIASLLPALIFYAYTLALLTFQVLMIASKPIATFSANLMFKRPFLLIGNAAGLISALIILGAEWTWEHV